MVLLLVISEIWNENVAWLDHHIWPHGVDSDFSGQALRDYSLLWGHKACSCVVMTLWAWVAIAGPSQA